VLATPRMVLRAVVERDILQLHRKVFSVPDVMIWAFGGEVLSFAETERFIHARFNFDAAPTGLCVLADRASDEVIGLAGLTPCHALADDDLEFGFVFSRDAWGRGLATEIGRAQIALGIEQLGRTRMLALVSTQNAASIRALEKSPYAMRFGGDTAGPQSAAGLRRGRRGLATPARP